MFTFYRRFIALAGLLTLLPVIAFAQEILTIESQVTGSKEQPKVITIVPWRSSGEPDYYGDDISGIDQYVPKFEPINRSSFIHEVQYIKTMRKKQ